MPPNGAMLVPTEAGARWRPPPSAARRRWATVPVLVQSTTEMVPRNGTDEQGPARSRDAAVPLNTAPRHAPCLSSLAGPSTGGAGRDVGSNREGDQGYGPGTLCRRDRSGAGRWGCHSCRVSCLARRAAHRAGPGGGRIHGIPSRGASNRPGRSRGRPAPPRVPCDGANTRRRGWPHPPAWRDRKGAHRASRSVRSASA
jgi:hypothetical protein